MTVLNLNNANALYYGNTLVEKLYKGNVQLYPNSNGDPYWSNVVLYLKGDGENNNTNIIDSSPNPKTITRFGDTKISSANSKYGGSSIYFDGTDYLQVTSISLNGDFTIEGWFNVSKYGWNLICNNPIFYVSYGTVGMNINGSGFTFAPNFIAENQWYHIAACRNNGVISCFINGIKRTLQINNTNIFALSIIGFTTGWGYFEGYIDSLRITKDIARYSSNFNPETDTYLAY